MELITGDSFAMELSGFDGLATDPPYHRSTATNSPVNGRLGCPDFSNAALLDLAERATKADSFLIVTTNYPNGAELHALSKGTCWRWRATQIWDKRPTRTWVSWGLPLKCVEYVHYFTRGTFKFSFKDGTVKPKVKRSSFGGKMKAKNRSNPNDVSYGMYSEVINPRVPRGKTRIHPTQKPTELSEMFARVVGAESRVLDPFCGSGALISAFPNALGIDLQAWWASEPGSR